MNAKTLSKINRFGKVGKIVLMILTVVAIIAMLLSCVAAIYVATLPKDAVRVTVTKHAQLTVNGNSFSSVWNMLTNRAAYAADDNPSNMLKDGSDSKILPPENTEIHTELRFFNQSYSSATIRSAGTDKIVDAKSAPAEYCSSDLVTLFVFAALLAASAAVALLMLQELFKVLSVCESPFCMDFVSKLRVFGYSLLPVAIIASVGETFAVRFLSAGSVGGVSIQWGLLIAFGVTMCLVTAFRYGVQLQKESDETL